ncbi:major histocompatibility complex class I-related gene protein-like [Discoglossus pictus]
MMERYLSTSLVLTLISTHLASAVTHSHQYLTTVTNTSDDGFPLYFQTRELDDFTLIWYDSLTQLLEVRVSWFKSPNMTLGMLNQNLMNNQRIVQGLLDIIMYHLNQTNEYHTLQKRQECILHDNGTIEAVFSYAYDGESLLSFSMDKANFTAHSPAADFLVNIINANRTVTDMLWNTLTEKCISHIEELLIYGNELFNQKEEPVVRLYHRSITNESILLDCRAFGHYPKEIVMTFYRNGKQVPEEELHKITLPLPNQTYLSSLSVNITHIQGDIYTCNVTHSSLEMSIIQKIETSKPSNPQNSYDPTGAVIAICISISLLVSLIVFSCVAWQKTPYKDMS